jgi:hypothetical protein
MAAGPRRSSCGTTAEGVRSGIWHEVRIHSYLWLVMHLHRRVIYGVSYLFSKRALNLGPPSVGRIARRFRKLNWWKSRGGAGAVRQSAEDLQRCDNGCSVSY